MPSLDWSLSKWKTGLAAYAELTIVHKGTPQTQLLHSTSQQQQQISLDKLVSILHGQGANVQVVI